MIILCVNKTFQNRLLLKISNKGFMVNQHLKTITKPQFELHLALQQDILPEGAFYTKYSYVHYLSHGTLWTCVAIMGADVW